MKTLITRQNIDSRISPVDHRFYADSGIILTAGAKDELRSRGVRIIYGPMPEAAPAPNPVPSGDDRLEKAVASISTLLRTKFGISDPDVIRNIIENALKALRNG